MQLDPITRRRTRWHRWWPFLVLLVCLALRFLLVAARPEADFTLASGTVGCAWAALVCAFLLPKRQLPTESRGRWWGVLLAGAMVFAGPELPRIVTARAMDVSGFVVALALTPVVVGITKSALGESPVGNLAGRVWPGIAGAAGLLLVVAQPNLSDARTDVTLALMPVITGVGLTWLAARPCGRSTLWVALSGGGVALALGYVVEKLTGGGWAPLTLQAAACDGVLAVLGVMALVRLGAVRWSAQFVLGPLAVLLEGFALSRQWPDVRWVAGIVVLIVAATFLLLPARDDDDDEVFEA